MNPCTEGTRALAGALLRGDAPIGPFLIVTEGAGAGRRLALGAALTLGRGREADFRLEDPGASRLHARLARDGRQYVATDLGSKNGLRVNGRRCRHPRALRPGDVLTIGATRMRFEDGPAAPASAKGSPARRSAGPDAPRGRPRLRCQAGLLAAALALLAVALLLLAA